MTESKTDQTVEVTYQPQHGQCPACGIATVFEYLGTQEWPKRVAEAMGFDGVVTLWQCCSCHTTLTINQSDLD